MRDLESNLLIGDLCSPGLYTNVLGREYDTRTGGIPERLLDANWPGDHMHPTKACVVMILGPTVGAALSDIDIDHRNRSTNAWAELCGISDTANAAGIYRGYIHKFRRFIRFTCTSTATDITVLFLADYGKREPVLFHDTTLVPADLTVTYA